MGSVAGHRRSSELKAREACLANKSQRLRGRPGRLLVWIVYCTMVGRDRSKRTQYDTPHMVAVWPLVGDDDWREYKMRVEQ